MKGRLKITVVIFLVTFEFTDGLTWNTKMRAAVCCQGNKQLLIWNFTEGENERVTELHWFFNEETLVCFVSNSTGFLAAELYEGRVERNGTAGILLKNVSLNDAGEYTLYVKLKVEKERNVQGINLTVVEPPPNQCKPIIKKVHPKGIMSCSTSCERSPLSLEWIVNGTKDPEDIMPYFVVNSSGTSEQSMCCLRDFKCVDDYQTKFCTQNNISFTEDVHTVNESVADTNHMVYIHILIIVIVTQVVFVTVAIACVILNRRRYRLFHRQHSTRTQDMKLHGELLMQPISDQNSPILSTDLEPHSDFNDVQAPVPVESNSNTVLECNKDLQQALTVAATTDRPLQDSNQHIQIVNNISIDKDKDFLQCIFHSNTVLMAELQAIRKETRKLKRQHYRKTDLRKKENRDKYSFGMTQAKRSDFKNNHTSTFETTESEDAFSETRKPKRHLHRKTHLRKKENRDKYSFGMTQVKRSDFKKCVPQPVQVTSHRDSPDSTSYRLMWNKPDDGGSPLIKYIIQYCEVEIIPDRTEYELSKCLEPFKYVDNILPSVVSYELSPLTPRRYYQVEIQAIYTQGRSLNSFIFKTKEGVPQPVQVTSHRDSPDSTSYRLTWNKPDDGGSPLIKYIIQYCEVEINPNGIEYELSKPLSWLVTAEILPSDVSYILSPLKPGSYYQVEVQAVNTMGMSSERFIFKTKKSGPFQWFEHPWMWMVTGSNSSSVIPKT